MCLQKKTYIAKRKKKAGMRNISVWKRVRETKFEKHCLMAFFTTIKANYVTKNELFYETTCKERKLP
jgi:hypothetical protein